MARFLRDDSPPKDDWDTYNCRILGTSDDLQTARQKAKLAEDTSNLESDDDVCISRKRHEPDRFINYHSNDELEQEHYVRKKKMYRPTNLKEKELIEDNNFQPSSSLTYENIGQIHGEAQLMKSPGDQRLPVNCNESERVMDRISRMTDIEKVNDLVRRAGYQPFTDEDIYYMIALQFKKTILMNESVLVM